MTKLEKAKKSKSFQSYWKETMATMDNSQLVEFFRDKKQEQKKVLAVAYAMTLGNVIQLIKREMFDRGMDYLEYREFSI